MNARLFLIGFLAFSVAAAEKLPNRWVEVEQEVQLDCSVPGSEKLINCEWRPPFRDDFVALEGLQYVDGERYKGSKDDQKCTIRIKNVDEKDIGEWKCAIAFKDKKAHFETELELATNMPTEIFLDNTSEEMDNETSSIQYRCISTMSNPKPRFSWYIDDQEMTSNNIEKSNTTDNFVETLTYVPRKDDTNKTLKCVVDFMEYGIQLTLDDFEILDFSELELSDFVESDPVSFDDNTDMTATYIVIILVGIAIICGVCYLAKIRCYKGKTEVDAETGNNESDTEKADLTKQEEKDEDEEVAEIVKKSFGDRFASMFRMNKSNVSENGDVKEEPEVVVEKQDEPEKAAEDKTEEVKPKANGFVSFVTKFLKPRDSVADKAAAEEPVKMSDCEDKSEDKEEKKDELEPEDKPEITDDNKEEKEPTPNTSF